jgi:hypothetical protein
MVPFSAVSKARTYLKDKSKYVSETKANTGILAFDKLRPE